jgi:hypothetical protein
VNAALLGKGAGSHAQPVQPDERGVEHQQDHDIQYGGAGPYQADHDPVERRPQPAGRVGQGDLREDRRTRPLADADAEQRQHGHFEVSPVAEVAHEHVGDHEGADRVPRAAVERDDPAGQEREAAQRVDEVILRDAVVDAHPLATEYPADPTASASSAHRRRVIGGFPRARREAAPRVRGPWPHAPRLVVDGEHAARHRSDGRILPRRRIGASPEPDARDSPEALRAARSLRSSHRPTGRTRCKRRPPNGAPRRIRRARSGSLGIWERPPSSSPRPGSGSPRGA